MNREREKRGYWSQIDKKLPSYKPPEKVFCRICGVEILPGTFPQIRYGVGIICKDCSDKRWRIIKRK